MVNNNNILVLYYPQWYNWYNQISIYKKVFENIYINRVLLVPLVPLWTKHYLLHTAKF